MKNITAEQALAALQKECWSLKCIDLPTGAGDADVGWEVVSHHMAKPHERREGFGDDPLKAIQAAISSGKLGT